ncbi:hypothetical protein WG922_16455 [Ramlibacter sp. AN1015]|uniref:hypothetical protein n=1 Tax=Ramlibacter sp. AN1015 TaxID=3133428 RepID=UPI0030BD54FC
MSLETLKPTPRPIDVPRDKPQVDRIEHANLDRPGAVLHPRAAGGWSAALARSTGWERVRRQGDGWR